MKIPFRNGGGKGSYRKTREGIFFDRLPESFLLEEDLPSAVQRVCRATIRIRECDEKGYIYQGTGLALGRNIITALHVVKGVDHFDLMHNGENIAVRQIAIDEDMDIALLESEKLLPSADSVLSEETGLGYDELYSLGYLWVKEGKNTYKERLCACKIEGVEILRRVRDGRFFVEIPSMARDFMPGFSGGMLVDYSGAIRGMTQGVIKETRWHFGIIRIARNGYLWGAHSIAIRNFLEQHNGRV